MTTLDDQLFTVLNDNNYVPEPVLKQAQAIAIEQKVSLYDALIQKDAIADENLGIVLADLYKTPFIRLGKVAIPKEVLAIVPEVVAKKQRIVAFERGKDGIKVATSAPDKSSETTQLIAKKTGEKVSVYFATEHDIDDAFRLYQKDLQQSFDNLLHEQIGVAQKGVAPLQRDVPIAKIVDLLIAYAYTNKASDIHIEPQDSQTLVRFRIDGILHDVLDLPKSLHDQVVSRIKVLARLRTDEHLSAQDGKLQVTLPEETLDIRVSIVPIVGGEKIVLRLLSSRSRAYSLLDLGLDDKGLEIVKKGFTKPYGMVLSTGPTGSGKSTTIYAILKIINTRERNIATIEDPVEYDIAGINQIQVNSKTNLTFASGLRAILRQDPDVIFVGEIRDEETASIAVNSAMTGHLVLSTLHTNNASTALPRFIDMQIEPFLVASTVNVIIAQRLVRKICESCRVSETLDTEKLKKYFSDPVIAKYFTPDKVSRIYKGKGCEVCHNTGYVGRIGIFEVLEVSEAIKELINAKASANTIESKAIAEGMTTIFENGIQKVYRGITTIEEVMRVTKE